MPDPAEKTAREAARRIAIRRLEEMPRSARKALRGRTMKIDRNEREGLSPNQACNEESDGGWRDGGESSYGKISLAKRSLRRGSNDAGRALSAVGGARFRRTLRAVASRIVCSFVNAPVKGAVGIDC